MSQSKCEFDPSCLLPPVFYCSCSRNLILCRCCISKHLLASSSENVHQKKVLALADPSLRPKLCVDISQTTEWISALKRNLSMQLLKITNAVKEDYIRSNLMLCEYHIRFSEVLERLKENEGIITIGENKTLRVIEEFLISEDFVKCIESKCGLDFDDGKSRAAGKKLEEEEKKGELGNKLEKNDGNKEDKEVMTENMSLEVEISEKNREIEVLSRKLQQSVIDNENLKNEILKTEEQSKVTLQEAFEYNEVISP